MSDVWSPGSDAAPRSPADAPAQPGALPDVVQVLSACIRDLTGNFVGFFLAGLGPSLVSVGLGLVLGLLMVATMVVPGMLLDETGEPVPNAGYVLLGTFGGTGLFTLFVIGITVPMNASLYRAVWAYLDRGEPLGFGAGFNTMFRDLPSLFVFTVVSTVLTVLGLFACYVGALGVSMPLSHAMPAMIVHRVSAFEAIRLSARHTRDHLAWNVGFWALGFAILMVAINIPLVGTAVGMPLYLAYHLRVYRSVFGSGASPDPTS